MPVKSDDLRRALFEIDNLLRTMHVAGVEYNLEYDDIDFLQRSRRSIITLLEARRKMNLHAIVSLIGWRDGCAIMPRSSAEDDATMVRPSQFRCGATRPYVVS